MDVPTPHGAWQWIHSPDTVHPPGIENHCSVPGCWGPALNRGKGPLCSLGSAHVWCWAFRVGQDTRTTDLGKRVQLICSSDGLSCPRRPCSEGPGMDLQGSRSIFKSSSGSVAGLTAPQFSKSSRLCFRESWAVEGHLHRLHEREV